MTTEDADLEELRGSVRKLLASAYPPDVRRRMIDDPLGHDLRTWRQMAQLGLHGLAIPEEYGGAGAPAGVSQVVFEELGAALYCGPFFASVALAAPALLCAADAEARARYLPGIADGSVVATLATTEPRRGWALDDIATEALTVGPDDWVLSGTKAYVVDAAAADVVLVTARAPQGVGLFAVQSGAPGCAIHAQRSMDLTRRLSRIEFDRTPAELLGDGDLAGALSHARDLSFVMMTAEQVGVATAALQMAVEYAGLREQFGRPIGQFQAIKHLCAEMLVDVESAAALAGALSRQADAAADDLALSAALAEALCSDVAFSVAARMIQVHGGLGFTWEHDAHLYYRRAKSSELMFGDGAWHRHRAGDLLHL
jgi:alkylation response protein AidB-like acyl-CoA dehydrogenase